MRQGPDGQREDDLGNALDHEEHDQQQGDCQKSLQRIAQEQEADDEPENDRDQLKPEMRHAAGADQADALDQSAEDEQPAEQENDGDGRDQRIDDRQYAAGDQQHALDQVPQRMAPYRVADGLAKDF